jgi:hypothetical protein
MAATLMNRRVKVIARKLCGEYQLGCGTQGGPEVVVHLARLALMKDPKTVLLKNDTANAFNSIKKQAIVREVGKHIPIMKPWTQFCIGGATSMFYNNARLDICMEILMEMGTPQGHGNASIWYSVTQAPALKATKDAHPGVLLFAIADDVYLNGDPNLVLDAHDTL